MEEIKTLVTTFTLAKLLKVSTHWVRTNRGKLPSVMIDGKLFFKVNQSKTIFPEIYNRRYHKFNSPMKLPSCGITMEKEDVERIKGLKKKRNVCYTNLYREAITHYFLNGKGK